ncbi:MAG: ATP-binding protein [Candidatus Cloacimonetes bacterium]|nr:ATP-binding protein [Candidatus Cloacimonadota bacterium]
MPESLTSSTTTQKDSIKETIQTTANELYVEKKYDELKQRMDSVLETKESSYCYRMRALAIALQNPDIDSYYNALDDIEKALALSYSEHNLSVKLWLLQGADEYIMHTSIPYEVPVLDYEHEKIELFVENGEIKNDERVNTREIVDVLDKLIEMNPISKYYELRAAFQIHIGCETEEEYTEILHKALLDIDKSIELEVNRSSLSLKESIKRKLGIGEEVLLSKEMALETDDIVKHLYLKADIQIQQRLYNEAINTLDTIIEVSPPPYLDSDDLLSYFKSNAYQKKKELFLKTEEYTKYTCFLKELLDNGISMRLSDHLYALIRKGQYNVLLDHFNNSHNQSAIILWFNICAHIALKDMKSARELLAGFSFEDLVKECLQPLVSETPMRFAQTEEKRLDTIFAAISFEKMSMLFFIDLLDKLYSNDICKESIALKYLEIRNAVEGDNSSYLQNYSFKFRSLDSSMADAPIDEAGIMLELLYSLPFEESEKIQGFALIKHRIEQQLISVLMIKNAVRIERAKIDERNRILSNLSHSIKNMLRSVIDPLINLKGEFPQKANVIDNAIKGANLIREMVTSINSSYKTSIKDINWDIAHSDSEGMSLQEMLLNSLKYSLGNMFDFRYFPQYAENYYPRSIGKDDFEGIKLDWNAVSSVNEFEPVIGFAEKYLCKLNVNLTEAADYTLGNEKSSAIKLMILFQEIIFNAVKYTSYVTRAERFIEIRLDSTDTKITLEVRNSFRPEVQAKTTGVGKLVIENFSKVLGSDPEIKTTDTTYSIRIEFNNLWRNNA